MNGQKKSSRAAFGGFVDVPYRDVLLHGSWFE